MGTKLILTATVLLILTSACSNIKKSKKTDFFVREKDFIDAYKSAFLCGCINESTQGNFYKFLKENNDLGLFTEGDLISHFKVKEADSLGKVFSNRIELFNYGDGKGKKPIFTSCFYYSLSKEVDSLAKISYRKIKVE
jgi:hypothetical protein